MSFGRELARGVFWVGSIDWHRRVFDELIPTPEGTSYNAYLVRGTERTALIDTVDPPFTEQLLSRLAALGVERLDYIVSNHAEQDHSGAIPVLLERYPECVLLATPKARDILPRLMTIPEERFRETEDGERLPLGGKTLRFIHAGWVHWPETMMTFLEEDRILFSCDLFGSHLATSRLVATDFLRPPAGAKRYYAQIMMPFARMIARHLERITQLPLRMIAPSHGPVHAEPAPILAAYRSWVSGPPGELVLIPYISMHGSTRAMVMHLVDALMARDVPVEPLCVLDPDLGRLAMGLLDAATVIFATPTLLGGPHPSISHAARLTTALRPRLERVGVLGSYSWGSTLARQLAQTLTPLKVELLEPIMARGLPTKEELRALDGLAERLAAAHGPATFVDSNSGG
jgi:flavorubredoxin